MFRVFKRKPRWLRLLGINRDEVTKWRGIGLSSMVLVCVSVALANKAFSSNSEAQVYKSGRILIYFVLGS